MTVRALNHHNNKSLPDIYSNLLSNTSGDQLSRINNPRQVTTLVAILVAAAAAAVSPSPPLLAQIKAFPVVVRMFYL